MKGNSKRFEITDQFLTREERKIFSKFLLAHDLQENIWEVFDVLFQSKTKRTQPLLLKVYSQQELIGVAILIKCKKYGAALFKNKGLAGVIDWFGIPCILWIKFGCCMDMLSNIGFVKDPESSQEVINDMVAYLNRKYLLTIITDYTSNTSQYPKCSILPSLPHALIDITKMKSIDDYYLEHKNIKRKIRKLKNNGGTIEIKTCPLQESEIRSVKSCFLSTAAKSVFYLPYQDLYLNSALNVSHGSLGNVYYFMVKIDMEIIGYQAAIISGKNLNALHGAFDRSRSSNHHAYDVLFVKMTEFALENNLNLIDYGLVLNITKQRMANVTKEMSYFLLSKNEIIRWLFSALLKKTKIQGQEQLKFRG